MKKLLSIVLILIMLISLSSCKSGKENTNETEPTEKNMTAYMYWFGITIDLRDPVKDITPSIDIDWSSPPPSFESRINQLNKKNVEYAVVRAKCVGNWHQKVHEGQDGGDHLKAHKEAEDFLYTLGKLYTEIPFEITEILEGNSSEIEKRIQAKNNLKIEYPGLSVKTSAMFEDQSEWRNNMSTKLTYYPATRKMIYPRIGCEYILILIYSKNADCIYTISPGAEIELSTPEELLAYYKSYHKSPQITEDDYIPYDYYEILERYNIKVR